MANAFRAIVPQSAASTSSYSKKPYDVFINHHGKDVKHKLASTIYTMLDLMGVRVFLDQDELKVGDLFPQAIEEAMRSAKVHIAIFSPRYAESPWCLEELSFMFQINVAIIPVFYNVSPSNLRYGTNGIYAEAFRQHEGKPRYDLQTVEKWKEALSRASYLNGCIVGADECDEGKLLREIVDSTLIKVKKVPLERVPLDVAMFPVGLDEAVEDFESTVVSSSGRQNVHIVGIYGMGGSGKTTLAKEFFNRNPFSIGRCSFLSNVRDAASKNTLHDLQKSLLTNLDIEYSEFHNIIHQGKGFLDRGFQNSTSPVLIVLDDVDSVSQLHALLPPRDKLRSGSFIIVTTRELDVLTTWGISCNYPMKLLDRFHAKQLFCKHAFLQPYSQGGVELLDKNYCNFQYLIERFVDACKGLPLALKVFGAMVNGQQKWFWESQLLKISRIFPKEIDDCLKLSYDALDHEDQQMFLDIACFFIGNQKSVVIAIWDGSHWSGEAGLKTLENKCLVALDYDDCIEMHDHLRDLGRRIAETSLPSRIWKDEQISNQGGRTQIRGIVFRDFWSTLEPCMEKIRPLLPALQLQLLAVRGNVFREEFWALSRDVVWLSVDGFEGTNLPSWLSFGKLTVLELYNTTNFKKVRHNNAQLPLQLRVLILHCTDNGMRSFPEDICRLESLEFLEMSLYLWAAQLTALPESFGNLTNLQSLYLIESQLTALPESPANLTIIPSLD